ncbi:MAG TPA: hypothetical protein VF161_13890 [Steroidobacteraceae bacterium]
MLRVIAFLASSLLALGAFAGEEKEPRREESMKTGATFEALDKNADSQISKTEARSDKVLSESFATLDTNGDGYLSRAEFLARSKT